MEFGEDKARVGVSELVHDEIGSDERMSTLANGEPEVGEWIEVRTE